MRPMPAASPGQLNNLHRGQDDEGYWPAVAQRIGPVAQAESPSIVQLTEARASLTLWSARGGKRPPRGAKIKNLETNPVK
jgi:hypothetical protein